MILVRDEQSQEFELKLVSSLKYLHPSNDGFTLYSNTQKVYGYIEEYIASKLSYLNRG